MVGANYWPVWYSAQLWWANHQPRATDGMRMHLLSIWVTPSWPDVVVYLLVLFAPPLALWPRWADRRRANISQRDI